MAAEEKPRHTFVVVLKDEDQGDADGDLYRSYDELFQETEDARRALAEALEGEGLAAEADLEPATGFNVLLVEATDAAVDCIRRSPRVAEVAVAPDQFSVDLL